MKIIIFEHASRVKDTEFLLARCLPSSENPNGPLVFILCTFKIGLYKQRIFFLHTFGRSKPARFILSCLGTSWERHWMQIVTTWNKQASVVKNMDIIITKSAVITQKKAKITCLCSFCVLLFFCFLLLFAIRRRLRSQLKTCVSCFTGVFQTLENNISSTSVFSCLEIPVKHLHSCLKYYFPLQPRPMKLTVSQCRKGSGLLNGSWRHVRNHEILLVQATVVSVVVRSFPRQKTSKLKLAKQCGRHSSLIFHYAVNFIGRDPSGKFKAWFYGKKHSGIHFFGFEDIFRC